VRLTARTRSAVIVCLSGAVAATGMFAAGGSGATKKTKTITCALTLFATIKQPSPRATNFGPAKCSKPFGTGVQQDSSKTTRTSPTAGSFTGPFKLFFDRGTIRGRFTISFVTTLSASYRITAVTYKGTLKVTGGTAAFRRVRGTGSVAGSSADAVKTTLGYKMKLSGVPPR
jgi:hypothetical protein